MAITTVVQGQPFELIFTFFDESVPGAYLSLRDPYVLRDGSDERLVPERKPDGTLKLVGDSALLPMPETGDGVFPFTCYGEDYDGPVDVPDVQILHVVRYIAPPNLDLWVTGPQVRIIFGVEPQPLQLFKAQSQVNALYNTDASQRVFQSPFENTKLGEIMLARVIEIMEDDAAREQAERAGAGASLVPAGVTITQKQDGREKTVKREAAAVGLNESQGSLLASWGQTSRQMMINLLQLKLSIVGATSVPRWGDDVVELRVGWNKWNALNRIGRDGDE